MALARPEMGITCVDNEEKGVVNEGWAPPILVPNFGNYAQSASQAGLLELTTDIGSELPMGKSCLLSVGNASFAHSW